MCHWESPIQIYQSMCHWESSIQINQIMCHWESSIQIDQITLSHWDMAVNVWECDYWLQEPPAWVANSIVTLGSAVIAAGWGATT